MQNPRAHGDNGLCEHQRCFVTETVNVLTPAGSAYELKLAPESGTTRGNRPGTPKDNLEQSSAFAVDS